MATKKKMLQAAAGNAGGGTVEPVGVDFDGTNDYLSRSTDLVGNTDSKTFTFSFWSYITLNYANHIYTSRAVGGIDIYHTAAGLNIEAENSAGTRITLGMDAPMSSLNTWVNFIVSCDLSDVSKCKAYGNDKELVLDTSGVVNDFIKFIMTDHFLADDASPAGASRVAGVYLDYTYRDLSVEANRRLFIDADGLYVTPPTSGIISVPMDDPDDVGRNDGTGGDFTLNGTIARSGRGPHQYNVAASTFDGGADYMENTSISTPTTKEFTFSAFIKLNANNNGYLFTKAQYSNGVVNPFELYYSGSNIRIRAATDVGGTVTANYTIPSSDLPLGKYVSVQISFDLTSTSNRYVLVNGNDAGGSWTTYSNTQTVAGNRACVGGSYSSTFGFDGDISDLYFDTSYIDLATENPFYDVETNKPKYLGESGELPTGSSPLIYLPLRADDAGNNLGTGGDFTVNSGPYVGARGASEFIARSADFNGSTGELSRAALTGASNGKTLSYVCAFKRDGTTGTDELLFFKAAGTHKLLLYLDNQNFKVFFATTGGSENIRFETTDNSSVGNQWNIVFLSMDTATSTRDLYVNNSAPSVYVTAYVADQTFPTGEPVEIGTSTGFIENNFSGDIGFTYFTTDYIDFSQEANRLKFVDAFGYPADLQPAIDAGDIPTPLIHMKFDDTASLGTNSGGGGDFTVNGTVTAGPDVKG